MPGSPRTRRKCSDKLAGTRKVRLFLDTSVLLAASGSERGDYAGDLRLAPGNEWVLLATPYIVEELLNCSKTCPNYRPRRRPSWARLRPNLTMMDDVLTLDQAVVFEPAKDRPILFGALAWAEVLLTLDRADFGASWAKRSTGLRFLRQGCSSSATSCPTAARNNHRRRSQCASLGRPAQAATARSPIMSQVSRPRTIARSQAPPGERTARQAPPASMGRRHKKVASRGTRRPPTR